MLPTFKGMQKQVAFWLGICTKPDLMVLDEPMDGLDPVMRKTLGHYFCKMLSKEK